MIWEGTELGSGDGSSKKQAETAAALSALKAKKWESKPVHSEPETISFPAELEPEIEIKPSAAKRAPRKKRDDDEANRPMPSSAEVNHRVTVFWAYKKLSRIQYPLGIQSAFDSLVQGD